MDQAIVPPGGALPPDLGDDGVALVALLDDSDGPIGGQDAAAAFNAAAALDAAAAHADPLTGGWVRGARFVLFFAGATACRAFIEYAESPALHVLRAFVPGSTEAALVLAGAVALVAYAAVPGGVVPGDDIAADDAEDDVAADAEEDIAADHAEDDVAADAEDDVAADDAEDDVAADAEEDIAADDAEDDVAADAEEDIAADHAEDAEDDAADVAVDFDGALAPWPAWVRGPRARVVLYFFTSATFQVIAFLVGSPLFIQVSSVVPGLTEFTIALGALADLIAFTAVLRH